VIGPLLAARGAVSVCGLEMVTESLTEPRIATAKPEHAAANFKAVDTRHPPESPDERVSDSSSREKLTLAIFELLRKSLRGHHFRVSGWLHARSWRVSRFRLHVGAGAGSCCRQRATTGELGVARARGD
jgi:hypothetical protein